MGVLSKLGLVPSSGLIAPREVVSPWTEGQLEEIVWSDIFGQDAPVPLTRAAAMRVPAVARARNLICTTVARNPLIALDVNGALPQEKQPSWMYRTDGMISPQLRTLWTIDDLLFFGSSLWLVDRGSEGQILAADRCPIGRWEVNSKGQILVDGDPVTAKSVIYFPSHVEGLLDMGRDAINAARNVSQVVVQRAASPVPVMEIHHEDPDVELSKTEGKKLVADYNAARRDPEGSTVFTPSHIKLVAHGDKADSGALVEARNAARLDIANVTGVPASLLEGSSAGASLTYVTTEGKRSEFLDYGVWPWIETFTGRLSLDDVVPRGQRVRMDLEELLNPLPSRTGSESQD